MVTLGFTFSYADVVSVGVNFPYVSSYIFVGTSGDLVWQAPNGTAQWMPSAPVGYNPISAVKILASGVVNGVTRTTTATNLTYCCAPTF